MCNKEKTQDERPPPRHSRQWKVADSTGGGAEKTALLSSLPSASLGPLRRSIAAAQSLPPRDCSVAPRPLTPPSEARAGDLHSPGTGRTSGRRATLSSRPVDLSGECQAASTSDRAAPLSPRRGLKSGGVLLAITAWGHHRRVLLLLIWTL